MLNLQRQIVLITFQALLHLKTWLVSALVKVIYCCTVAPPVLLVLIFSGLLMLFLQKNKRTKKLTRKKEEKKIVQGTIFFQFYGKTMYIDYVYTEFTYLQRVQLSSNFFPSIFPEISFSARKIGLIQNVKEWMSEFLKVTFWCSIFSFYFCIFIYT